MLRYADALKRLLDAAAGRELGAEDVPLARADGRVAAEVLRAPGPLPRFDNSAMDGYALAAARTAGASRRAPARLPVAGRVAAGDAPICRAKPGFAWEVSTGAPLPAGCDAIVPVERALRAATEVLLVDSAEPGDFVRRRGADLRAGATIVEAGARLGPGALMALAAAGVARARVRRRPKVVVLATGRELVAPGVLAGPGQVHDGSSTFLEVALPKLGAEPLMRGRVPDDAEGFLKALRAALKQAPDLVLTTGAVSKGRFDFVAEALGRAGCRGVFHGVAMRPGKPVLAAALPEGRLVLGLPGNPVSTVVGFRFFAAPVLRAWLGLVEERPLKAALEEDADKPEGLRCFFKALVSAGADGATARVLPGQASFQVAPLVQANGWAVLPEAGARVPARAPVDVYSWLPEDLPFPALARRSRVFA